MRRSKGPSSNNSKYCKEHQGDGSHYAEHNCEMCTLKQSKRDEEIWLNAWLTTAGSSSCVDKDVPTVYADRCLNDFKRRFR